MESVPWEVQHASESIVLAYGESRRVWGRWGDSDEKGALNYLIPERRVAAASLIRTGEIYPLGLPIKSGIGAQAGGIGRFNPIHVMNQTGHDSIGFPLGGAMPTSLMML